MDKFVEFYGPGLSALGLADRATIANMAPGVRRHDGLLPGGRRDAPLPGADRPRRRGGRAGRALLQGAGAVPHRRDAGSRCSARRSSSTWATVVPSLAGPERPQDRVPLRQLKRNFVVNLPQLMSADVPAARQELAESAYSRWVGEGGANVTIGEHGAKAHTAVGRPRRAADRDGSSTARTSRCTTARWSSPPSPAAPTPRNPSVMIGAGLLAKKAVERGLTTRPGSRPAWPRAPGW